MAEADVGGGRNGCQVVLVADETARQGVGSGVAFGGAGFAEVTRRGAVQAGAGNQAVLTADVPGQFAEGAVVVEVGVLGPGLALVCVHTHTATLAMFVGLRVNPADQLHVGPAPGGFDACTHGAAVDVADHRHAHHAATRRRAQAVVVHHMVGVVVVDLRLDLVEHLAEVGLFKAQAQAFALELRAVHAAPGVAGFAITLAGRQFQQGVLVGCPAEGDIAVPLVPARRHGVVVAVVVVVRT
ncbi:hypothetical protein D3C81_1047100 [compost metagenome]